MQHFRLLGVLRDAIHLSLQLRSGKRPLPVILQRLRFTHVACYFLFQLCLRHHCIQRWLWIGALFWPYPVTPVNFLNRSLVSYALCKRQCRDCGMENRARSTTALQLSLRRRFGTEESQQPPSQH
jgi:hypothetical protein